MNETWKEKIRLQHSIIELVDKFEKEHNVRIKNISFPEIWMPMFGEPDPVFQGYGFDIEYDDNRKFLEDIEYFKGDKEDE